MTHDDTTDKGHTPGVRLKLTSGEKNTGFRIQFMDFTEYLN